MVRLLLPVGVGVGDVAVPIVGTVTNVPRVGDLSLNGGLVGGTVDDAELTDPHAPLLARDGGGRTEMQLQEFAPCLVEVGCSDSSRVGSALLSERSQDGRQSGDETHVPRWYSCPRPRRSDSPCR